MKVWNLFSPITSVILTTVVIIVAIVAYVSLKTPISLAQTYNRSGHDTQSLLWFAFSESPVCPYGQPNPNVSSYGSSITVSLYHGSSRGYRIKYTTYSYFCTSAHAGSNYTCLDNRQVPQANVTSALITPGHPVTINIPKRSPTVGNNCGTYQTDLVVYEIDNANGSKTGATYGTGEFNVGGATLCETGVQCTNTCNPIRKYNECEEGNPTYCLSHGIPKGHIAQVTQTTCGYSCKDLGPCNTPTPTSTPTPTPPQFHFVCENFACVRKAGPGDSQCRQEEINSPLCSHLACIGNACTRVNGVGQDQCTIGGAQCQPPQTHLTVVKVVNNNHGGTKQPGDFVLRVNGTQVTTGVVNTENPGDYTVSEDNMDGYHQVSISGDCDSTGHVHLNTGDNKTCVIENEDNGTTACTMPTCSTNIPGCSYPSPDTTACSCGPLVCITQTPPQNITVNVNQQQQQQQEVLAASVAPAAQTSELPKTGAGAEVLFSLFGLLPLGWKLRKMV